MSEGNDKWYSGEKILGLLYDKEYVDPSIYNNEGIVNYNSNRFAELFGRGTKCSFFPGYGKIYNRKFEVWFQDVGDVEKKQIMEYRDIANEKKPPVNIEKFTNGIFIGNELSNSKGYKLLFNERDAKNKRTWYAGLIELEFTGIIASPEK